VRCRAEAQKRNAIIPNSLSRQCGKCYLTRPVLILGDFSLRNRFSKPIRLLAQQLNRIIPPLISCPLLGIGPVVHGKLAARAIFHAFKDVFELQFGAFVHGTISRGVRPDGVERRGRCHPWQKRVINAMEEPNQLTRFLDSLARVATSSVRQKALATKSLFFLPPAPGFF
jgi:hypothetical protein